MRFHFATTCVAFCAGCHLVGDVTDWDFQGTAGAGGTAASGGGGSATSQGGAGGGNPTTSTGVGGAPPSDWWDSTYGQRIRIIIEADTAPVPVDASVYVSIDTQAMIASDELLPNGDDLRIVRWDGDDWVELPRWIDDGEGTGLDGDDTRAWFKVVSNVDAATLDADTYLYFDNPNAGPAPAEMNDVFLFGDDFEGTLRFTKNGMGELADPQTTEARAGAAALEISPGTTPAAGVHHDIALPYVPLLFSHYLRQNATGSSLGTLRAFDVNFPSRTPSWNENTLRAFCELNSGNNLEFVNSDGVTTWHAPFGTATWHRLEFAYNLPAATMRARIDGGNWSGPAPDLDANGNALVSVAVEGEGQSGTFQLDNYVIRLLVDPEPSVTLGETEASP